MNKTLKVIGIVVLVLVVLVIGVVFIGFRLLGGFVEDFMEKGPESIVDMAEKYGYEIPLDHDIISKEEGAEMVDYDSAEEVEAPYELANEIRLVLDEVFNGAKLVKATTDIHMLDGGDLLEYRVSLELERENVAQVEQISMELIDAFEIQWSDAMISGGHGFTLIEKDEVDIFIDWAQSSRSKEIIVWITKY